jgi:hypothetical protein
MTKTHHTTRRRRTLLAARARQAANPCADCFVRDPQAMLADPDLAAKLAACTLHPERHQLWCHQGMPVEVRPDGTHGAYRPPRTPDGAIDTSQLTPCGGAARWAAQYVHSTPAEIRAGVQALLVKMVGLFLAEEANAGLRTAAGGSAALVAQVLTDTTLRAQWHAEGLNDGASRKENW